MTQSLAPLIMLGEGGVEWRPDQQAVVALPPLNMNLARYLVIQAIKSGKIRGRSALRPLDVPGISQVLIEPRPGWRGSRTPPTSFKG